ncbi:S1 RNA-binding domain-containing protein [Acholeplasma granularum]|uniref:S1 RNA-binding domain-containing protein n=1 Tax=Acholeplasma granularum TaxID=264635 RepID=UPI00046F2954|nr:S1 RNA-binding domain-containing protein [Acholeplasma granularum]
MNDFIFPKKGQVIEGEVFQVKKNLVLLSFNAATEGTIYAEYFDQPAPADLRKVVKVGDKVRAKVVKVVEEDHTSSILLSRLPLLHEKHIENLEKAFNEKTQIETTVKSFNEKGLVLTFEGIELFLPFSLLDFELKDKKEELVGTNLVVLVEEFKMDRKRPKLIATRKPIFEAKRAEEQQLRQEQRQEELETIQTGDVVEGTVESFEAHAAFIRFQHVSGMLRISQVSHHRIEKIEDALTIGENVKVKVIKKEGNRLDLSMKALLPTPYEAFIKAHKVGQTVKGKVVSKLPFGVLVELEQDVKGLLHKSEYSWNPKDNFDSYIKIGDEIEAAILNMDAKKERIALSKKVLEDNPWAKLSLRQGEDITVRVESVEKDGVHVSYQSVDGLIPTNEAHNNPKVNIEDHYQKGDEVLARVIEVNKANWVLILSVKRLLNAQERQEFEKYLGDSEDTENITLGDLFSDLNKKNK